MGSALTRSPGAAASPAVTLSAPVKERPPGRDKGRSPFSDWQGELLADLAVTQSLAGLGARSSQPLHFCN